MPNLNRTFYWPMIDVIRYHNQLQNTPFGVSESRNISRYLLVLNFQRCSLFRHILSHHRAPFVKQTLSSDFDVSSYKRKRFTKHGYVSRFLFSEYLFCWNERFTSSTYILQRVTIQSWYIRSKLQINAKIFCDGFQTEFFNLFHLSMTLSCSTSVLDVYLPTFLLTQFIEKNVFQYLNFNCWRVNENCNSHQPSDIRYIKLLLQNIKYFVILHKYSAIYNQVVQYI